MAFVLWHLIVVFVCMSCVLMCYLSIDFGFVFVYSLSSPFLSLPFTLTFSANIELSLFLLHNFSLSSSLLYLLLPLPPSYVPLPLSSFPPHLCYSSSLPSSLFFTIPLLVFLSLSHSFVPKLLPICFPQFYLHFPFTALLISHSPSHPYLFSLSSLPHNPSPRFLTYPCLSSPLCSSPV